MSLPSRPHLPASLAVMMSLAAAAPAWTAPGDDSARWAQVRECGTRPDSRARHACVDEVLRAAGVLTADAEAREQRQRFGLGQNAAAPAPVSPPAPPAIPPAVAPTTSRSSSPGEVAVAPPRASSPPPTADGELHAQIARVRTSPDRRLIFTTTDGAEWRQSESQEIVREPKAGDAIIIHRGVLGGFRCELPNRATWRCARTR